MGDNPDTGANVNVTETLVLLADLIAVAESDDGERELLEAARDLLAATVEPFDADSVAARELARALPD